MRNYKTYILLAVVFTISLLASYFWQTNEALNTIFIIPSAASLVGALFKIFSDELTQQRTLDLQYKQQDYALGTASYMAKVTYDKHTKFCEEYVERVQRGRGELFMAGPSEKAMDIGRDLVLIRQRHATWLTTEIESSLKPFEQALINIGAKHNLLKSLPIGEQRTKIVDEIYDSFGLILDTKVPQDLESEENQLGIDRVIEKIRNILGVNTLTTLRTDSGNIALKRHDTGIN